MTAHRQTDVMTVSQGSFELSRWPARQRAPLQAWDAADEYLLHHLHDEAVDLSGSVVIINDGFGALATALGSKADISWGDSLLGHRAMAGNLERNERSGPAALPSTVSPSGPIDVVLLKFPKHNALLEDQLHRLRPQLRPGTIIIGSGMVKNVHTSTLDLLESVLGPTRTSLAKKKARLAFTTFDPDVRPGPNPWPLSWTHDGLTAVNHGGVFSARSIDVGSRFLLENLPSELPAGAMTVDLGCGNGIVGASLLRTSPKATCLFVDESYAAVDSARQTVAQSVPGCEAQFALACDLGEVVQPGSVDLVVNNPPFHASSVLSTAAADEMFRSSHRALRTGGELRVIGNRHLGYHLRLKRLFGTSGVVASNSKFVVIKAVRQ